MKIAIRENVLNIKKILRRYLIVTLLSLTFLFVAVTHAVAQQPKSDSTPGPVVCTFDPSPSTTAPPPPTTPKPSTTAPPPPTTPKPITVAPPPPTTPKPLTVKNATIEFINAERTVLRIEQCSQNLSSPYPIDFLVNSPEPKKFLEGFSSGDRVNLSYSDNTKNKVLESISVVTLPLDEKTRWLTIGGTGVTLAFLTWFILGVVNKQNFRTILELFVGQDNRLSNSKSQMAVWFFVLVASYISLTWLRAKGGGFGLVGGIGIPQNLLLLSGVSALTYAGAKVITQGQVNNNPGSKQKGKDGEASLANFVTDDDGNTDFGDFQMTIITILAIGVYCVQLFNFLGVLKLYRSVTLPEVDATIMSIFGLSQGAYLAKKAAVASAAQSSEPAKKDAVASAAQSSEPAKKATGTGAAQSPEPLEQGMKGEEVKKLRAILNKELALSDSDKLDDTDDNFDQKTEDAVKAFQKQNDLGETGIVDSKTREKLGMKG